MVELLEKRNAVSVAQFAEILDVSKETVRRDLRDLEEDGILKRTHGGAVLEVQKSTAVEYPFNVREVQRYKEKNMIAKEAAAYIEDGDTIFIDNSSTTLNLIKYISSSKQVTIITNSIRLLIESATLAQNNLTILSLGGIFRTKNYSLIGAYSLEWAANFKPTKAFISCRSILPDEGLSDGSIYEAETKRALINSSKEVFVLADHSKFSETGSFHLANFNAIDYIITDSQTDKKSLQWLNQTGAKIVVAQV